jgi:hypothetical protein
MKLKKSPGPSLATVAATAALLFAVLGGAAYFLRDDGEEAGSEQHTSATTMPAEAGAASALEALVERCEEGSTEDVGGGRTRTRCTVRAHPAFMMEVIAKGDEVERASLMVPLRGSGDKLLERTLVGLELFSLVAGAEADVFLPKEYLDAIGRSETRFVFQGRLYMTEPIANVGLIFGVMPESTDPGGEN